MSNLMIDDESSRLKQFAWEELDEHFFLAVIFRSGRRYVVQRYFEQQLYDIKSPSIQLKWRRCLLEVLSKTFSSIYLTRNEVELMHEIFSWHLNSRNTHIKLRENIDSMIDFEDLIDCSHSIPIESEKSFLIQPVTTLDAARKSIEMWKNLQENFIEKPTERTAPAIASTKSSLTSPTGWLQLDSKIVPFIKKHCDRLLPVEYLLKQNVINSSEDFFLHSLYIPISFEDIDKFQQLIDEISSINIRITHQSLLITLDHLIFRLKRLFFIRFLSSPKSFEQIDYKKIMSLNGGLITSTKQRLPFIYINKQKYIPQLNERNSSTFCIANKYELEFLRLMSLYDYLSSDENNDNLINLFSITNLTLIPHSQHNCFTMISFHDFHYHEYQRRSQQQKNLSSYNDDSQGWCQPPSSKHKRSLSHFKFQRPILF